MGGSAARLRRKTKAHERGSLTGRFYGGSKRKIRRIEQSGAITQHHTSLAGFRAARLASKKGYGDRISAAEPSTCAREEENKTPPTPSSPEKEWTSSDAVWGAPRMPATVRHVLFGGAAQSQQNQQTNTEIKRSSAMMAEIKVRGRDAVLHQCSFREPSPAPDPVDQVKSALSILTLRVGKDQKPVGKSVHAPASSDPEDSDVPDIEIAPSAPCPFPLNRDAKRASLQTQKENEATESPATAIKLLERDCRASSLVGMREYVEMVLKERNASANAVES